MPLLYENRGCRSVARCHNATAQTHNVRDAGKNKFAVNVVRFTCMLNHTCTFQSSSFLILLRIPFARRHKGKPRYERTTTRSVVSSKRTREMNFGL